MTRILISLACLCPSLAFSQPQALAQGPPNIVLIMADDLGFSDIGCYGSEIPTPNLDRLAEGGVVFTNFSNTSRCCPSRASLLTGLYSHAAGIGDMNYADKGPGYRGQLQGDAPTLPELLKSRGYATCMVGKWHLTRSRTINNGPNGSWPLQRGFERFYGTMEGAKNYFRPIWLFDQEKEITSFEEEFFYTDAISEFASKWLLSKKDDQPLFLYAAFYAPHFPLQAPSDDIKRHQGKYAIGWDELRKRRFKKQKTLGIIPENVQLSARPTDVPSWNSLTAEQKQELDLRMATYAAQVEMLDRGVGRIVDSLRSSGKLDNTLLVFLSDNGGASSGGPFGAGPIKTVGSPDAPVKTTYGKGWATLSNTPFRLHKANTHEGGIASPLILHWPNELAANIEPRNDIAHIIDITPTLASAGKVSTASLRFDGIDLLHQRRNSDSPVFYEHEKSRAVRLENWKLVNKGKTKSWELYNLKDDRTESKNLADANPQYLRRLQSLWMQWAKKNAVKLP